MARTQVTGIEIENASIKVVDLGVDIVPYIKENVRNADLVSVGESLTILANTHHVVMTEQIIEGDVLLFGTMGII